MSPPRFDQDLGFCEAVKDLAVEEFLAQRAVEAFIITILSR
jgi:hypothetical protein